MKLLSYFIVLFTITTAHSIEYVLPTSKVDLLVSDIKRFAPEDEIKLLMAGETEFTALLSEQTQATVRGVAILLPDMTVSPAQASAFLRLRYQLNDYGWITLAGLVPDLSKGEEITQDEAVLKKYSDRPNSSTYYFPESLQANYRAQIKLFVSALQQEAKNYPGLILFVAQGATAGWLIESFEKKEIKQPDALVLIAPYLPDHKLNQGLATKIARLPMPILDVWSEQDSHISLSTVSKRVQASKRHLTMHYRQRELFGLAGFEPREARLGKEIYGYLTYLGW